jgi:hypothetical protein
MVLNIGITYTEFGCMDNSKHLCTANGYDYKKYHYVCCNCPCDRYAQSFDRGRCEECLHFRAPKNIVVTD